MSASNQLRKADSAARTGEVVHRLAASTKASTIRNIRQWCNHMGQKQLHAVQELSLRVEQPEAKEAFWLMNADLREALLGQVCPNLSLE